jgi:hypothetical protein
MGPITGFARSIAGRPSLTPDRALRDPRTIIRRRGTSRAIRASSHEPLPTPGCEYRPPSPHRRRARSHPHGPGRRQRPDQDRPHPAHDRPAGLDRPADRRAVKLWLAQNGSKVAGRTVEVILKDDGAVPDTTKRLAQELIVNDKVTVLAGFGITPTALATAPLATQSKRRWS